jgi:hypothetical protein
MLDKATDLIWEGLLKGGLVSKEEYDTGKLMAKASTFSNVNAFTDYATSQGTDPGTIEAVVKEMTDAGGQWMTGGNGVTPMNPLAGTTGASVNAGKDKLGSLVDSLPAGTQIENLQATIDGLPNLAIGANLPSRKIRRILRPMPTWDANYTNISEDMVNAKTQEGADFYAFTLLNDRGLPEKQAFEVTSAIVGLDRMKSAYKALTGKDWAG